MVKPGTGEIVMARKMKDFIASLPNEYYPNVAGIDINGRLNTRCDRICRTHKGLLIKAERLGRCSFASLMALS